MGDLTLYEKVGKRYKPYADRWEGFPANGVWLVQDGKQNCVTLLSEIPEIPKMATAYRIELQEPLMEYIAERASEQGSYSFNDVAKWACDGLAELNDKVQRTEK